jgi:hypothetical protein
MALLVDAGVTIAVAAAALGVSRRTGQRVLARQRGREGESLEELCASLPTLQETLAAFSPTSSRAPRRRRPVEGWREAARWLEEEHPESWGLPGPRD